MDRLFDNSYVLLSNGKTIHRRTQEVVTRILCPTCRGQDKASKVVGETYPERETVSVYIDCETCGGHRVVDSVEIVHYFSGPTTRLERIDARCE